MESILILAAFFFMLVLAASEPSRRMTPATTVVVGAPQRQSHGLLADLVAFLVIVGFLLLIFCEAYRWLH